MDVPEWVKDAIFYQIFPDRFFNGNPENDPENVEPWGSKPSPHGFQGGDLEGIIQKMGYLLDLGINAIYLNPIFLSTSTHRYDTVDYFQIDKKLGDLSNFHQLINIAHQNKVRIILDGVFNHTGRGFFAFLDNLENENHSAYKNWYQIKRYPIDAFGPGKAKDYKAWWDYKSLPKLNTDHPAVREFIFSVAKYWIDQGCNGWRLDVPNEIDDDDFWAEFRSVVKAANPDAFLVGEIWERGPRWVDDGHFDSLMNYPLRDALLGFLKGDRKASQFQKDLQDLINLYPEENTFAMFNVLGSHDTERLKTVLDNDIELVKMAFVFQMAYPGAPVIYYGDEVGLTGGKDPECRKAFPWEKENQEPGLREWVEKLIQIRRVFATLRKGSIYFIEASDRQKTITIARQDQQKTFLVMLNAGNGFQTCDLNIERLNVKPGQRFNNLIGEEFFSVDGNGKTLTVNMPAKTAFLLLAS